MLIISVKGVEEGRQERDLRCPASDICDAFPEFVDDVQVHIVLTKVGSRLQLACTAACDAILVCDYSTEEYRERIETEFNVEYIFDTELYLRQKDHHDVDATELYALHEDDATIEISDHVVQELAVRLPLKRISPEYRDKNLEDIVGNQFLDDGRAQEGRADENWAMLKNIRIENN